MGAFMAGCGLGSLTVLCVSLLAAAAELRAQHDVEQLRAQQAEERARRAEAMAVQMVDLRQAIERRLGEFEAAITAEMAASLDHDCLEQVMQREPDEAG